MRKSVVALFAAFALSLPYLTGCDQASEPVEQAPAGVTSEEQAMAYFATNDEFVVNDEVTFQDAALQPIEYGTFGKIDAAITPLRFGRFITSVKTTVTVTIEPGDSLAIAKVEKEIAGILRIRGVNENQDTILVEKPFTDNAIRKIAFKRVARDRVRYWFNWLPVGTTLVSGGTATPNDNVKIIEAKLFMPNGDEVVVTDPLSYWLRYRWVRLFHGGNHDVPEISPGDPVKLQVKIESKVQDPDIVTLRYGFLGLNARRVKLELVDEQMSGGIYTRTYETSRTRPIYMHFHRGFFHMGIDALTKETLFDDTAPYSVSWWGVPYRVM